ncbi:MAG: hypothetical protein ACK5QX_09700 [bacterium]
MNRCDGQRGRSRSARRQANADGTGRRRILRLDDVAAVERRHGSCQRAPQPNDRPRAREARRFLMGKETDCGCGSVEILSRKCVRMGGSSP